MKINRLASVLPSIFLLAVFAQAEKIPSCRDKIAYDVREARRSIAFCLKLNVVSPNYEEACAGLNLTVFQNRGDVLPRVARNQQYYEGRVGADNQGGPGKRRIVTLLQGDRGPKAQLYHQYFTEEHYEKGSFCQLPQGR